MIKKLIVMAALLSLVWPSMRAAEAEIVTGLKLLEMCERDPATYCHGYIMGAAATVVEYTNSGFDDQVCIPKDADILDEQLRLIYINWAKRNPAMLHHSGSNSVRLALVDAFPCE